jgi:hypothetical protein
LQVGVLLPPLPVLPLPLEPPLPPLVPPVLVPLLPPQPSSGVATPPKATA